MAGHPLRVTLVLQEIVALHVACTVLGGIFQPYCQYAEIHRHFVLYARHRIIDNIAPQKVWKILFDFCFSLSLAKKSGAA